jgi:hypothetical protein
MEEYFCKGQKRTLIFGLGSCYYSSFKENYTKNGLFKFKLKLPDLTFIHYGGHLPGIYLTNNIEKPVPFLNVSPTYSSRVGSICFHDFYFVNAKQIADAFFNSPFSYSMADNGLRKYVKGSVEDYYYNSIKFLKEWESDDNYLEQFGIQ